MSILCEQEEDHEPEDVDPEPNLLQSEETVGMQDKDLRSMKDALLIETSEMLGVRSLALICLRPHLFLSLPHLFLHLFLIATPLSLITTPLSHCHTSFSLPHFFLSLLHLFLIATPLITG